MDNKIKQRLEEIILECEGDRGDILHGVVEYVSGLLAEIDKTKSKQLVSIENEKDNIIEKVKVKIKNLESYKQTLMDGIKSYNYNELEINNFNHKIVNIRITIRDLKFIINI